MSLNPPIIVNGSTPRIDIKINDYDLDAIVVYFSSIQPKGLTVTVRDDDGGVNYPFRYIRISTTQGVKFEGLDNLSTINFTQPFQQLTVTSKNPNTWIREVPVIQGVTPSLVQRIYGYGTIFSTLTVSSFSTNNEVYVAGSTILEGALIGYTSQCTINTVINLSSYLLSSGILYTSSLFADVVLPDKLIANNLNARSTIGQLNTSTTNLFGGQINVSSIQLFDTKPGLEPGYIYASNSGLYMRIGSSNYLFPTLNQSGFSNFSSVIAPNLRDTGVNVSTVLQYYLTNLFPVRWDPGLSSFSTQQADAFISYSTVFTSSINTMSSGMFNVAAGPGISSMKDVFEAGLININAFPGANILSNIFVKDISSLCVEPGLSTLSTVLSRGLSSVSTPITLSSFSSMISPAFSSVATLSGVDNLLSTVTAGMSSIALLPGFSSVSDTFKIGISTIATGPGMSSLAILVSDRISSLNEGITLSSFSSLLSYGLSSIAATSGYSTLFTLTQRSLSTNANFSYSTYQTFITSTISVRTTSTGTSTMRRFAYQGLSSMNFVSGLSSISSLFSYGVSTLYAGGALSTLSTTICRGLSDVVVYTIFPSTYSTTSTFVQNFQFVDVTDSKIQSLTMQNGTIRLNTDIYFSASNYPNLNIQTMGVQALGVTGPAYVSSIATSSINVSSGVSASRMSSLLITATSTNLVFLQMIDRRLNIASNVFSYSSTLTASNATNTAQQIVIYSSGPGVSSMSTLFGRGETNLRQGVDLSNFSTSLSRGLSTINFQSGISSLWLANQSNTPDYNTVLSTTSGKASTATFVNLTVPTLETSLASTMNVTTDKLFVSSLILQHANFVSFQGDVFAANVQTSSNLNISSLSTSQLRVLDTLNVDSIVGSTLFAGRLETSGTLYTSTLLFEGIGFSTLNAKYGKLYLNNVPLFIPQIASTFSTTNIYASSLYTSTFLASTFGSTFTMDVQGVLSSGVNSSQINDVRVRGSLGTQNWGLATVGGFWSNAVSSLMVRDIYGRDTYNRPVSASNDGSDPGVFLGQSILGSTLTIAWDGIKLLVGGRDNQGGSNLIAYVPPSNWANNYAGQSGSGGAADLTKMWSRSNCTHATPFVRTRDVEFNGDQYVAVGNATTASASIQYSIDGLSWSNTTNTGIQVSGSDNDAGMYSVAWNGYTWVAGGSNSGGYGLLYSDDGKSWSQPQGLAAAGLASRVIYTGKYFLAFVTLAGSSGLYYSETGSNNWLPATTSPFTLTTATRCTALTATNRYVFASFVTGTTQSNWAKSYDDGVTWTGQFSGYSNENALVNPTFDGQAFTTLSFENNVQNRVLYLRHLSPNLSGSWLVDSGRTQVQGRNTSLTTPFATHSNVLPSLTMSNLKVYGSTFHNVYASTNTIVGFANSGYGDKGQNQHFERANYLQINNTIDILAHMSTQVVIKGFSTITNVNSLPKATFQVNGTANANAMMVRKYQQVDSNFNTSQPNDASVAYSFTGNTRMFSKQMTIGRGTRSNAHHSTPITFFDVYCASNSFAVFRDHNYDGTACNAIKNTLTNRGPNVSMMPLVTGINGNLWHFWRVNGVSYSNVASGTTYFTGQHPTNCIDVPFSQIDDHVGELVSVTDEGYTMYDTSGNKIVGKDALQITSATPITKRTTKDMDPNVFGVITNAFNTLLDDNDGTLPKYTSTEFGTQLFGRIMVNSIGEGGIWVTNYNGYVQNGDYLCSSPIPGLARKQDDGRLWNYTVAKATMSCDFNPKMISTLDSNNNPVNVPAYKCEQFRYGGSTFMKAFIGCTYHCG